jgi:hypothetical protein
MTKQTFKDAFNLLCGKKLGGGIHREVYECRLRPELVVKVELEEDWRSFANVREMLFWSNNQHYDKVAKWLSPCDYMSPDGRILLQRKVQIASATDTLPSELPSFLTDLKPDNFGWLDGRFVCVDYALSLDNPNIKPKKVKWHDR